jgi:hypothetical protein
MRGRQSVAMLRQIGMDDLIVDDIRGIAERAAAVARDPNPFRMRIGQNRDALFDRDEPIRELANIMSNFAAGESSR